MGLLKDSLLTESGRISRTKLVGWLGLALQLLNLALLIAGAIPGDTAATVAGALGVAQGWLTNLLRNMTNEPMKKTPPRRAPGGFASIRALLTVAAGAFTVALLLAVVGCTSITTGPRDNVEALLDVGPPYTVQGRVNGKPKCTMTGTGELRLRGKPGQCMIVNPAGVWEKKPAGCIPKAPEGSGND